VEIIEMASDTYGEILSEVVDDACKYEERADVFRRAGIRKGHYYNVINPEKKSSSCEPYHCPTEWGVSVTNLSGNFKWLKAVAVDCGCIVLTPEDIKELKDMDAPEKTLQLFMKIIGRVNKK
jgi:hypothetical protein